MNVEAILIGLFSATHTPEQAEHAAKTVLGLHAHQLAEEIRADRDAADVPGSPATPDMIRGMTHAAGLIDSEEPR
jgi:hypothetical protein